MNRKITGIFAAIVIIVGSWYIGRELFPHSAGFDATPALTAGRLLADETAKSLNDHGNVVAIIEKDNGEAFGVAHSEWEAFRSELKKHPGIALAAPEIVPPSADGMSGCSNPVFKEILDRHTEANAIVFLTPFPAWGWFSTRGQLPEIRERKVLVLTRSSPTAKLAYGGYLDNHLFTVLVLYNGIDTPKVYTPKTVDSLPE